MPANTSSLPTRDGSDHAGYLLLFRGEDWDHSVPTEELERFVQRVHAWFDGLAAAGKVRGGQAIGREGAIVSARAVVDGPFIESKEAIGGFLHLAVHTLEEAVAIAKSCPTLEYGITIEVRPALNECPVNRRIQERLASAAA